MDFRRITAADREQVAEFALRGLRPERMPLVLSRARVMATIDTVMASETHFHLAAFDGARMVGGICCVVAPLLFFERCELHVVMLFATAPGVGFALLRRAMTWARQQPSIRRVLWSLEDDADAPRLARIARRYGFNREHTLLAAYKE